VISQHLVWKPKSTFSCLDRNMLTRKVWVKFGKAEGEAEDSEVVVAGAPLLEELPVSGTIFCGARSKGITNNVKREFKDRGRTFDIAAELGSQADKVQLDEAMRQLRIQKAGRNFILESPKRSHNESENNNSETESDPAQADGGGAGEIVTPSRMSTRRPARKQDQQLARKQQPYPELPAIDPIIFPVKEKPRNETRPERIARLKAEVEENQGRMRSLVDAFSACLFCQQCKTVGVDSQFLLSHFHIIHPGEEVVRLLGEQPQAAIARLKRYLRDIRRKEIIFHYLPTEQRFATSFYRCSYCPTTDCQEYADLFRHTAEAHNTKVLTCNICQNIFLNYGSLISHLCSGPPTSAAARARFACKMCHRMDLSSFLDFQRHIRHEHHTCEICFKEQGDQTALHAHCATHDQDLMCMKCFVTFEKADSFRKHMFWKHSAEQSECPACHTPTWPHVYHFCLPHLPVACHTCELTLPNAAAFKVHQRQHSGRSPHTCDQPKCDKSFISKSLLWKHQMRRHPTLQESVGKLLHQRRLRKDLVKFEAKDTESLEVVYGTVEDILTAVMESAASRAAERSQQALSAAAELNQVPESSSATEEPIVNKQESVLDAAIRSIMPEPEEEPTRLAAAAVHPDHAAIQATIAGRTYTEANSWQAGIDALLAGASLKVQPAGVPAPSALPPAQIFQTTDHEEDEDDEDRAGGETQAPVIGGLWNQDLMFVGRPAVPSFRAPGQLSVRGGPKVRGLPHMRGGAAFMGGGGGLRMRGPAPGHYRPSAPGRMKVLEPTRRDPMVSSEENSPRKSGLRTQWDLDLSESSDEETRGGGPGPARKLPALKARQVSAPWRTSIMDHDYCYAAFLMSQKQPEDTAEMEKIASNVAFGGYNEGYEHTYIPLGPDDKKKRKKKRKEKKKKKRRRKGSVSEEGASSTDSEVDVVGKQVGESGDVFGIRGRMKLKLQSPAMAPAGGPLGSPFKKDPRARYAQRAQLTPALKRMAPKPKYHTPDVAKTGGVVAGTARPNLNTDSDSSSHSDLDVGGGKTKATSIATAEEQAAAAAALSDDAVGSSDLDTDFTASGDEAAAKAVTVKAPAAAAVRNRSGGGGGRSSATKPTLKLKIKLPPQQQQQQTPKPAKQPAAARPYKRRRRSSTTGLLPEDARPLSKKMRESLALNEPASSEDDNGDEDEPYYDDDEEENDPGCEESFGGEDGKNADADKLYCYCQCPHDEVSEMIGCDAPDCRLEWFHFECVNVLVPPEGKWYCPECTKRYGL